MERDLELYRKILRAVKDLPGHRAPDRFKLDGYTEDEVGYNSYLMKQDGLVEGVEKRGLKIRPSTVRITEITSAGHAFLEASKNDTAWQKTMKYVQEKGASLAFDAVVGYLVNEAKKRVGLS